jgi:D-alanyl-lipoteichoic acid acyltransferase DltB (MBOAT superfamily)
MLFNSFEFLVFFPVVTILFYLLPKQFKWLLLLTASCIFYCYFIPVYLLVLVFTIVADYFVAILIEQSHHKKRWLVCSIVVNVGTLAIFKYYNFFATELSNITHLNIPLLNLVLPIGLSFHTFQAMSYTIEVYKGSYKAERHIGIYALYVLFYPQLVAGPIERPQHILPQLKANKVFTPQNLLDGLRLVAWGFFKKLVIADKVALYVNIVYNHPNEYHALNVTIAIFLFSLQIYCDFSGYTDIARGAARTMGFDLMVNFNRPFFAKGIRDFWRRWHISLSSWFRDYVYIPLGGSRNTLLKMILALLTVFALSGFWHGAGWNYIIWGLLHALFVISSLFVFKKNWTGKKMAGILFTNFLVAYAFVFFRNPSVAHAIDIIRASFNFSAANPFTAGIHSFYGETGIGSTGMAILAVYIAFLFFYEYKTGPSLYEMNRFAFWDLVWFVFVVLSILFFGVFTKETFIYFQF